MRERAEPGSTPDLFFRTCSVDELFKLDFDTPGNAVRAQALGGLLQHGRARRARPGRLAARALRHRPERIRAGTTSTPKAWSAPGRSCWKAIWTAPSTRWTPTSTRRGPPTCSNVLRHDFAATCRHERPPLRDERPLIVRDNAALFESWLDRVNARVGARNFPVHVEVRVRDGHVSPIEFNPLRFAGLGGTDVSWLGYGFRTYAAFLDGDAPGFGRRRFAARRARCTPCRCSTPPAGAPAGARFDYDAFDERFSHVLEMRPLRRGPGGQLRLLVPGNRPGHGRRAGVREDLRSDGVPPLAAHGERAVKLTSATC